MEPVREKRHRLPDSAYHGRKTVSFTACINHRRRIFTDAELVEVFVEHLTVSSTGFFCLIPIYCFMPDHLHVMIQGTGKESRPKQAMDDFKYRTGRWFAEHRPHIEWQADYHDHIIRASNSWKKHAFYILQNPLRAGLVIDP